MKPTKYNWDKLFHDWTIEKFPNHQYDSSAPQYVEGLKKGRKSIEFAAINHTFGLRKVPRDFKWLKDLSLEEYADFCLYFSDRSIQEYRVSQAPKLALKDQKLSELGVIE